MPRRYAIPATSLALVTACAQPDLVGEWTGDDLEIDGEDVSLHSDDGTRQVEVRVVVGVQLDTEFTYAVRQTLRDAVDEEVVYLASYGWAGEAEDEGERQYQLELESLDGVPDLDLECQVEGDTLECEGELGRQEWALRFERVPVDPASP